MFIGNLFTHGVKCFINSCLFHEKWISIADMDDSISLENELKLTEDILDQLLQSFKRLTWNFIIFLQLLCISPNLLVPYLEYIVQCHSVIRLGSLGRIMFSLGNHKKSTICISGKRILWLVNLHNVKIFYNQVWMEYIT